MKRIDSEDDDETGFSLSVAYLFLLLIATVALSMWW
jgi:hypothetical protein